MKKVRIGVLASGRVPISRPSSITSRKAGSRLSWPWSSATRPMPLRWNGPGSTAFQPVPAGAKGFKDKREEYDALLVKELQKRSVDIVCLAGFMRIITPVLIKAFPEPDTEHPPFPAPPPSPGSMSRKRPWTAA